MGLWYTGLVQKKGTIMEAVIHVAYSVTLDDEDAEKIETGEMTVDNIDWSYYIGEATQIELDCVDILQPIPYNGLVPKATTVKESAGHGC